MQCIPPPNILIGVVLLGSRLLNVPVLALPIAMFLFLLSLPFRLCHPRLCLLVGHMRLTLCLCHLRRPLMFPWGIGQFRRTRTFCLSALASRRWKISYLLVTSVEITDEEIGQDSQSLLENPVSVAAPAASVLEESSEVRSFKVLMHRGLSSFKGHP